MRWCRYALCNAAAVPYEPSEACALQSSTTALSVQLLGPRAPDITTWQREGVTFVPG